MCCANGGWHGGRPDGDQKQETHLALSVNDKLAGAGRVLNPNDDGGADGFGKGPHHGQSEVSVIPEEFTVKLILEVRKRLPVRLVIQHV